MTLIDRYSFFNELEKIAEEVPVEPKKNSMGKNLLKYVLGPAIYGGAGIGLGHLAGSALPEKWFSKLHASPNVMKYALPGLVGASMIAGKIYSTMQEEKRARFFAEMLKNNPNLTPEMLARSRNG